MEEKTNTLLELLLRTGQLMLENGAETYRAEYAVLYIFDGLGEGYVDVFALATMITVDIVVDNKHYTGTRRIRKRSIDLSKIEQVNSVSRDISSGILGAQQALIDLNEIDGQSNGNKLIIICASGLAAGMFSLLLDGGTFEFFIAFLCCSAVQTISLFSKKTIMFYFFISFVGGLMPALFATFITSICQTGNIDIITIGAMLPLFPGVAMVNAIRDTMNGDLVSGVARGAEAILTAVGLAVGAMVGFSIRVML